MNSSRQSAPPHLSFSEQMFLLGSLLIGLLISIGIINSFRTQGRLPSVKFGYSDHHQHLLETSKHRESLPEFRTAALIDFDNAAAQLQLLQTAYELNNAENVMLALRGLLSQTPDDADLHGRLAVALLEAGNADEALLHINRAVKIDPANAGLLTAHGAILLALGRIPEAATSYQKALQLNPDLGSARRALESLLPKY